MKNKTLSRVLVCGALLTMTGTIVVPAISTPIVAQAATQAAVADDTSDRSITLTKYQATDLNDHDNAGDGTSTNQTRKVLKGVEFKLQRVKAVSGKTLSDAATAKEGTDYTVDTTFVAQTKTTDDNGKITWDLGTGKANDGIYLVTEVNSSAAIDPTTGKSVEVTTPSAPFFVQVPMTNRTSSSDLIYAVVVEPKNVITDDLEPVKTINDKNGDAVLAGNSFEWELTTNIPSGLYSTAKSDTEVPMVDKAGNPLYDAAGNAIVKTFKAGEAIYMEPDAGVTYYDATGTAVAEDQIVAVANFTMTDNLNTSLKYLGATVWALPKGETDYVELPSNYYKITAPAVGTNGVVTMELTKAGIMAMNDYEKISTHLTTKLDAGFDGLIPNTFETTYQTPGGKPTTPVTPPVEPKTFTGGFNILKVEKGNDNVILSGAVFHIASSEANATAGKFLAADGKSYTADEATTAGVTLLSATTNTSGRADFDGLPLTWTDTNANGVVDENGDVIERDYWAVETTAPTGYELLKSPQKITVNLNSAKNSTIELKAEDEKQTNLPFTGGVGTALMITIALGAITIGTATIVINKKRNNGEA